MKVLLLIISSNHNKLYLKLEEIHQKLCNLNYSWLDIILIKNNKNLTNTSLNNNILEIPLEEIGGLNIFKKPCQGGFVSVCRTSALRNQI